MLPLLIHAYRINTLVPSPKTLNVYFLPFLLSTYPTIQHCPLNLFTLDNGR